MEQGLWSKSKSLTLEDVLAYCLPHLTLSEVVTLAQTSKKVKSWVCDSLKSQDVFSFELYSDDLCASSLLGELIRSCPRKRLVLSGTVTDAGCHHLGLFLSASYRESTSRHFTELEASRCSRVSDQGLESLIDPEGSLRKPLMLSNVNLSGVWRLTDRTVALLSRLPRLERLNVSRCYRLTDASLNELHGLTALDLSRCVNVVNSITLRTLAENNPELVELNLTGLASVLTDQIFQDMPMLAKLYSLNIEGGHRLTDASMFAIARFAPNLRTLVLSRCTGIASIQGLGTGILSKLQRLEINGCQKDLLAPSVETASKLAREQRQTVTDCLAVSLEFLEARQCDMTDSVLETLGAFSKLQTLALCGNSMITDAGLERFAKAKSSGPAGRTARVKELLLGGCGSVTSAGMRNMFREGQPQDLKTLQLPPQSDDRVLEIILQKCPQLQHLDLGKSKRISDHVLIEMVRRMTDLRTLKADETNISDKLLRAVPSSLSLERFTAYACANTTREAFDQLHLEASTRKLNTLMDREGRMLRCTCCSTETKSRRQQEQTGCNPSIIGFLSGTSGGLRHATTTTLDLGRAKQMNNNTWTSEAGRFLSMEAPMIMASCLAIALDWYCS